MGVIGSAAAVSDVFARTAGQAVASTPQEFAALRTRWVDLRPLS